MHDISGSCSYKGVLSFKKLKRPYLLEKVSHVDEVISAIQAVRNLRRKRKNIHGLHAKLLSIFLWLSTPILKFVQYTLMEAIDEDYDKILIEENAEANAITVDEDEV